jgi:hypothetical protein
MYGRKGEMSHNAKNISKSFGQYFQEINAHNTNKYFPNGKILSNLATLKMMEEERKISVYANRQLRQRLSQS